jgi:hypothetical protein
MATFDIKEDEQPKSSAQVSLTDTLSRISPPPTRQHGRERRNPSVTPRKFNRFFAPRPQPKLPISSSRRALHDISASGLNRSTSPFNTLPAGQNVVEDENLPVLRASKRRKASHVGVSLGPAVAATEPRSMSLLEEMEAEETWDNVQSSPCTRPLRTVDESDEEEEDEGTISMSPRSSVKPIVPMRRRGLGAQLLSMSISGGHSHDRQRQAYPAPGTSEALK